SLGGGIDQRRTARQLGELAHEVTGAVGDDRLGHIEMAVVGHRDAAGKNDDETRADLNHGFEPLAGPKGPSPPAPAGPADPGRIKARKDLIAPVFEDRLGWVGHHAPPPAGLVLATPAMIGAVALSGQTEHRLGGARVPARTRRSDTRRPVDGYFLLPSALNW